VLSSKLQTAGTLRCWFLGRPEQTEKTQRKHFRLWFKFQHDLLRSVKHSICFSCSKSDPYSILPLPFNQCLACASWSFTCSSSRDRILILALPWLSSCDRSSHFASLPSHKVIKIELHNDLPYKEYRPRMCKFKRAKTAHMFSEYKTGASHLRDTWVSMPTPDIVNHPCRRGLTYIYLCYTGHRYKLLLGFGLQTLNWGQKHGLLNFCRALTQVWMAMNNNFFVFTEESWGAISFTSTPWSWQPYFSVCELLCMWALWCVQKCMVMRTCMGVCVCLCVCMQMCDPACMCVFAHVEFKGSL